MLRHFLILMISSGVILMGAIVSIAQESPQTMTRGAYQNYENGVMLWRADTGDIWVLYDTGEAESFPISIYDSLPDNPVRDVPDNRVVPVNGFGRIWGNFSSVRNKIGTAVSSEVAYTMAWELQSRGGVIKFSLLVNVPETDLRIAIHDIGRWEYHTLNNAPVEDDETVYIAYQSFENGHMVYDFDTGSILVVTETATSVYQSRAYGALSLDPVTANPPAGLEKPILGFGKVWGHFPSVRASLGWATTEEYAYFAPLIDLTSDGVSVILPDGMTVYLTRG